MGRIVLTPRGRDREYVYPNAKFDVRFLERVDQLSHQAFLQCTITHGCDVKDRAGQTQLRARETSVYTLQGQLALPKHRLKFDPTPGQQAQLTGVLPQNTSTMRIILRFYYHHKKTGIGRVDDKRVYTGEQGFDVPINPDWAGEIQVSFDPGPNQPVTRRMASSKVPFTGRSWGLPASLGSAVSPVRQLQEIQASRRVPPELQKCMMEVRRWLTEIKPRATYPVHANNAVTFYNDASKDQFGDEGAFADIYDAMEEAKHFIFIADWSFHPDVYLKRQVGPPDIRYHIGRMLINKALRRDFITGQPDLSISEKILVAIHTWHHFDPPANDDPKNNGAETRLKAINQERYPGTPFPPNLLWRATERFGVIKTHHQKFVVLDAPVPGNPQKHEIKVFFGGLDLTTGRFDWHEHPIDDHLQRFQQFEDWYNPEFEHDKQLPRQPWHDIYAQLVGPTAWDFVTEFVGRWNVGAPGFQVIHGPWDMDKLVWKKFQELLSNPDFVRPFDPPVPLPVPLPQGVRPRIWTTQVYRSMEKKFWYESDLGASQSRNAPNFLQWGLDKDYEKSIHKAYLQAIQRAENFIYIETQYLISGDHAREQWFAKGHNHIPSAIVNRILEKYKVTPAPDFHVYIVLPMFPEGAPNDWKLRPVRYFQWETIRWMRQTLTDEMGKIDAYRVPAANKRWNDYLSFYFLGKRTGPLALGYGGTNNRKLYVTQNNRYMIYVHSKMMIVDDKWIIVGSANLNERSMSGRDDSEICVGMWATPGNEAVCQQEIQAFREDLWREHLGNQFFNTLPLNVIAQPHNPHTSTAVQTAARTNLRRFRDANPPLPPGHLMLWELDPGSTDWLRYIPDDPAGNNPLTRDEWRVRPHRRGIAMLAPNEFLL